ncbi:hypothetical protein B0T14DRAFT_494665 [Immersiella caudata]|uniref:Myb-like domain-containing protein n=1 Tax=Immersiella caudata TaxID=314043 RepID=A0AA40C367_9PEZI|nr:hypothetical protein B0T14DRAFT_494665 [Immersiella caudata]
MLKIKTGFKPKVPRRNAPTPGSQDPGRISETPAPTTSQSQPLPSPSPAPSSTDKRSQVPEVPTAPEPEPEQNSTKPAARRRIVDKPFTESSAADASIPNNTPAETPAVQQPQAPEQLPSTEQPPPNQSVPVREKAAAAPVTTAVTPHLALTSILPTPPETGGGTGGSSSALPAQSGSTQQALTKIRLRRTRASNSQDEVVQTATPAPSGARSDEAHPSAHAAPEGEVQAAESAAAPESTAPRGRKRNARSTPIGGDTDTSQTESSTAPKKKPRVARRAAPLPGEEGYQTAAEKRTAATSKRGQKRKSQGAEGDTTETGGDASDAQPKRKSSRLQREPTPEDAENVEIDRTQVKMADLIKDMRVGKKFSLHDELMERQRKKRQKKKVQEDEAAEKTDTPAEAAAKEGTAEPEGRTSALAPVGETYQVIDGVIVVDQRSLQVNRHARAAQEAGALEEHEENEFTHHTTSATYLRRNMRPQQWTDEETDKFFRALSMFGTDFETIARMFPGKQRKHIKLKFNREERSAPARIQAALVGQKTVGMDMEEYKRHTGSEYETAEAIYAEQKRAEEEFEAQQKAIQQAKEEEARKRAEELFGNKNKEGDEAEGGKKKKGRGRKAKTVEAVW